MDFAAYFECDHKCPACAGHLEHISTDDPSAMVSGGFSICKRCGHIFWLDIPNNETRNLTRDERAGLADALSKGNSLARQMRAFQEKTVAHMWG